MASVPSSPSATHTHGSAVRDVDDPRKLVLSKGSVVRIGRSFKCLHKTILPQLDHVGLICSVE